MPLTFDLYVEYSGQYLKYRKATEFFEEEISKKFRMKKIKKVYVLAEQESAYLEYLDSALNQLSKPDMNVEQKAEFVQESMRTESENIERNLESETGYKSTENRVLKVVDFISSEPKSIASMLANAGLSVDTTEHASNVSTLALALAVQLGIKDKDELMAISIAALLHDIGLNKLGFNAGTDYSTLQGEDRQKYRKHPSLAMEQTAGKRYITPKVLKLIEEHEEKGDGNGFPNKKNLFKLPLSSQIFNLCDHFDHFCISVQKKGKEALPLFLEKEADNFDLHHVEVIEKLL